VQVLIEGLRANGVEVFECNVPLRMRTAQRVALLKQPWRLPQFGWQIFQCWRRLSQQAVRLPEADAVIVGYLGAFDIHLAKQLFPKTPLVLDCMATLGGATLDRGMQGAGDFKTALAQRIDAAAFRLASLVMVDTEEQLQTLPATVRAKGIVVLVGAPGRWLAAGEQAHKSRERAKSQLEQPLKVLFFGNYIPLQGVPVIGEAIAQVKAPLVVTLIGDGQTRAETERALGAKKDEIIWKQWVNGDDLPKLVASQDVCLGIFGTTAKAQRVVPNKAYQGVAAGCVVITSDTEPQRRVLGDNVLFVPPGNAHKLAKAIEKLARDRTEVTTYQEKAYTLAREQFTPEAIVKPLLERLR